MRTLSFPKEITVTIAAGNRSVGYARWFLQQAGVVIQDFHGTTATDCPVILPGELAKSIDMGENRYAVLLWDFQVLRRGTGFQGSAVSGVSWVLGLPHKPPLALPADIPEKWCGLLGASIALSFFLQRPRMQGVPPVPQMFDVAAAELLRAFADQNAANHKQIPGGWRRNGRVTPEHGGIYPQGFFACKDGYVAVVARSKRDWEAILAGLGNPGWAGEHLRDPFALAQDSSHVDPLLIMELQKYTRDELLQKAIGSGATIAPVYSRAELKKREGLVRTEFFDLDERARLPFRFALPEKSRRS